MHRDISFLTYGRQTMGQDWYIAPIGGVCRLYMIHSGTVLYRCETEEHVLRPDTLYLFPQNLTFQLITDENTCVDHTYFDFFATPAIFKDSIVSLPLFENALLLSAFSVLEELTQAYPFHSTKADDPSRALIISYLCNLLTLIRNQADFDTVADPVIEEAMELIHRRFSHELSVENLAAHAHLDTNVFIRRFKRCTNTTPYQYIKNYRINLALSLIKTKRYTLSEIAERCGYADASSLSHAICSVVNIHRHSRWLFKKRL